MTSERKAELILYVKEVTQDWIKKNRVLLEMIEVMMWAVHVLKKCRYRDW